MKMRGSDRTRARLQLARLDAFGDDFGGDWLTEDEAARLQAMASPGRRRSFLAGHWLARELAAEWLQVGAARIGLGRHADGRPLLQVDGAPSGVDIELPRRARDYPAMARFAFSPEEAARLDALDDAGRRGAFHVLWTLKEARGKRSGEGLLPGRARRVTSLPSDADAAEAASWGLEEGALALAIDPGATIDIIGGETLHTPAWWRYREDG